MPHTIAGVTRVWLCGFKLRYKDTGSRGEKSDAILGEHHTYTRFYHTHRLVKAESSGQNTFTCMRTVQKHWSGDASKILFIWCTCRRICVQPAVLTDLTMSCGKSFRRSNSRMMASTSFPTNNCLNRCMHSVAISFYQVVQMQSDVVPFWKRIDVPYWFPHFTIVPYRHPL